MKKLAIIKLIALFLGIAIIFCIFCIVNTWLLKQKEYENAQQIKINLPQKGEVKSFNAANNKIYLHIVEPESEQLMILDENTGKTITTINLIKGEN